MFINLLPLRKCAFFRRPVAEDSQGFSPTPPSAARACVCSTQGPALLLQSLLTLLQQPHGGFLSAVTLKIIAALFRGFTRGALSSARANGVCIRQLWESLTHSWKEVNVNLLTSWLMIFCLARVWCFFSLQHSSLGTCYCIVRDNVCARARAGTIKQVCTSCQSCFRVFPDTYTDLMCVSCNARRNIQYSPVSIYCLDARRYL